MSNKYTFIGNSAIFLAKALYPIIPGLSKLVLVYFSEVSKNVEIKYSSSSLKANSISDYLDAVYNKAVINTWRKKSKFEWLRKGEEPFATENNIEINLNIDSEKDKTILCLKIPCSLQPGHYDLLFFYLKPDMTNFGPNPSNSSISTESKNVIHILLEGQIKQLLFMKEMNLKAHARYNRMIHDSLIDYKVKINDKKTQIVSYAIHHLNTMSSLSDYQYIFTVEAIEKIKDYTGDLHMLPEIIEEAAEFTQSANPTKAIINIDDRFICFNDNINITSEQTQQLVIKYPEVAAFLDKYEEAIDLVLKDGAEVKSITVGKKFTNEIKESAISQAISARRKKIYFLLTQYQDKWPLMRQHFRPIQSVLNKGKNDFDDSDAV